MDRPWCLISPWLLAAFIKWIPVDHYWCMAGLWFQGFLNDTKFHAVEVIPGIDLLLWWIKPWYSSFTYHVTTNSPVVGTSDRVNLIFVLMVANPEGQASGLTMMAGLTCGVRTPRGGMALYRTCYMDAFLSSDDGALRFYSLEPCVHWTFITSRTYRFGCIWKSSGSKLIREQSSPFFRQNCSLKPVKIRRKF